MVTIVINNIKILINGDNNIIHIGNNVSVVDDLTIYSHELGYNRKISVGNNTSFFNTKIYNYDNNSSIVIGEDCMFAYNTVVYNTDSHSIFQNGELINIAEKLTIGDHVWICENANVLKNSTVSNNSIIARNALVSGVFSTKNCILGGVPAKIIKENIEWDRKSVNETLANMHT